jgi:hypothetical protein
VLDTLRDPTANGTLTKLEHANGPR